MFIFFNYRAATAACMLTAMFAMADMAYDASMINNLLLSESFVEFFQLTSTYIGLNVAVINVGNFIAGPFTAILLDRVGRKLSLLFGNTLAIVGVLIAGFAKNEPMLLVGRLLLGFALTVNGVAGPSLVAESTPGTTHILLTNAIVIGMPTFGTISAAIIYGVYNNASNWPWRGAILGELAAPFFSLLCLPFAPESPRWLIARGRNDEAFEVLMRMHKPTPERDTIVKEEFEQMVQTLHFEKAAEESGASSFKALVASPSDRKRFLIVLLLNIFFQVSGSNTFPYFFSLILQQAGIVETRKNLDVNMGLCIWGVASVAFGVYICGRIGAKISLVTATSVMTVCLALIAVLTGLNSSTGNPNYGYGAVAIVFVFQLASFSTYMILTYTYPPSILRYTQRAKGFALAQSIGYGFCVMMSYTLPLALEHLGWKFYAINAAWDCVIVAIIWFLFVETKGKSLEEIDALFDGHVHFETTGLEKALEVVEGVEVRGDKGGSVEIVDKGSDDKAL